MQPPLPPSTPAAPAPFALANARDTAAALQRIEAAATRGDHDAACKDLRALLDAGETRVLPIAPELFASANRWDEVVNACSRLEASGEITTAHRVLWQLARNMLALREHRPRLYARLKSVPRNDRFKLTAGKGGAATIADCRDPERPVVLSVGHDPIAALKTAIPKVNEHVQVGKPIGLHSIGDGYLLNALAHHHPKLFLDQTNTIHVFEPEAELFVACMMIHAFDGDAGAFAQQRIRYHVGEDWSQRFLRELRDQPMLLPPTGNVTLGPDTDKIAHQLSDAASEHKATIEAMRQRVFQHYESATREHFIACFDRSPQDAAPPARKPRVLLPTSRFTTVLQYAARDAAAAFEELGWEVEILIERELFHRGNQAAVLDALDRFKPDLLFLIDHLRSESKDIYPPNLPVSCWVQDHLPNLTNVPAGQSVGVRDYVLSFCAPLFTDTYQYPPRQMIDMPMMLTRPITANDLDSVASGTNGDDLVYVSNVSQQPHNMLADMLERAPAPLKPWMDAVGQRVLATYDAGDALCSYHALRELVYAAEQERGEELSRDARSKVVELIWNPLNIGLYRQQALRWVADAATKRGLTLALYGNGWEHHPDFKAFARGPVEHGEPLQRVTRAATINLNLEPYPCFTHHRLLDGLVAGGFFLVRDHPSNTLLQALNNLLSEHADDGIETLDALRDHLRCDEAVTAKLNALLLDAGHISLDEGADPIRQVRCWQRAGVLIDQPEAIPHLAAISFHDAASFAAKLGAYIDDAEQRRAISADQRCNVEDRLSFKAGMALVTRRIAELLRSEHDPTDG